MSNPFESAELIADAVLFEGYVLYPYRASAAKNRLRWQFGVIAPRPPRDKDGEPWFSQTECLIATAPDSRPDAATSLRVSIRLRALRPRFMPPQSPAAPDRVADRGPGPHDVLDRWLEGVAYVLDLDSWDLGVLPAVRALQVDAHGVPVRILVKAATIESFVKLHLLVENLAAWQPAFESDRDLLLAHTLVSAHALLAVDGGAFVSLLEPPPAAEPIAAACENRNTYPVLVGDRSRRNTMLSSPIVLYDYPAVAKESPLDLCDAAEIDEILSLRIMTLTDEEKREARATDPRSRAIVDRVEALTPEALASLHGTMRSADFFNPPGTPSPEDASVMVDGVRISKGAHVRLRPSRRADAMDIFFRDQAATVAGVYRDVDERVYVAVTVDADPAAALHESFGRFFYFDPSEVEPARDSRL
jgi:hypothetical protein